jgi:hypothetical protein
MVDIYIGELFTGAAQIHSHFELDGKDCFLDIDHGPYESAISYFDLIEPGKGKKSLINRGNILRDSQV